MSLEQRGEGGPRCGTVHFIGLDHSVRLRDYRVHLVRHFTLN
jgi:hypothetical protein